MILNAGKCSTAQCSAVQYNVQCSAVQCSAVQCSAINYLTASYLACLSPSKAMVGLGTIHHTSVNNSVLHAVNGVLSNYLNIFYSPR